MEQHGNSSTQFAVAVVPARYASERLPGKMLLPIAGKPLLIHTLERVRRAQRIDRVIAAVDDQRLFEAVSEFGFEARLTSPHHNSGSDRIAEVALQLPADSLVINIQGDEPLIDPLTIDRVADALRSDPKADMATVSEPITSVADELLNPNVVKLVCDDDGYARYFSRSPIPFPRDAARAYGGDLVRMVAADRESIRLFRKHIGIYGYRRDYLLRFANTAQSKLERTESLEQLRALSDRALIRVVDGAGGSIGVDIEEDYLRVKGLIESGVSVRSVREDEWRAVAEVHVAAWRQSFAAIVPRAHLDSLSVDERQKAFEQRPELPGYQMLVAEVPGEGIVGFADFGAAKSLDDSDAEIHSFYVRLDHQQRGIGGQIFRTCLARLRATGCKSLCVETLEASPYRAFYDKMGARVVKHSRHDIGGYVLPTVIYFWSDISAL